MINEGCWHIRPTLLLTPGDPRAGGLVYRKRDIPGSTGSDCENGSFWTTATGNHDVSIREHRCWSGDFGTATQAPQLLSCLGVITSNVIGNLCVLGVCVFWAHLERNLK